MRLYNLFCLVHSHHEATFYKMLDELWEEFQNNAIQGYKGEGFYGPGYRVGLDVSHNLPEIHQGKKKGLEMAEARKSRFTPYSGKLGGNSQDRILEKRLSPREMAARAAERRRLDSIWCGQDQIIEEEDDDVIILSSSSISHSKSNSNSNSKSKPHSHSHSKSEIKEENGVIIISDSD